MHAVALSPDLVELSGGALVPVAGQQRVICDEVLCCWAVSKESKEHARSERSAANVLRLFSPIPSSGNLPFMVRDAGLSWSKSSSEVCRPPPTSSPLMLRIVLALWEGTRAAVSCIIRLPSGMSALLRLRMSSTSGSNRVSSGRAEEDWAEEEEGGEYPRGVEQMSRRMFGQW